MRASCWVAATASLPPLQQLAGPGAWPTAQHAPHMEPWAASACKPGGWPHFPPVFQMEAVAERTRNSSGLDLLIGTALASV